LPLWASQATLPEELRARQRAIRLSHSACGLAGSLRGMGTGNQPSYWERLPDLDRPALVLAGQDDTKFAQIATQMHAELPQARLEIVPNAGHAIHLERPWHYLDLITGFMDNLQSNDLHLSKEDVA
jgi:2-succinyl-6-hydroxy-2,4-cyclohexadiene-1-carboxylate synthase